MTFKIKKILKKSMLSFAKKIYPYNRSIVSKEVLKTLKIIKSEVKSLKIHKIKSSTKVYDWKIPKEWKVKSAKILDLKGNVIVDYNRNNLHLVSHSTPINQIIKINDLRKKIFYLKKLPNAIPYRTFYYKKDWGFCISYKQFKKMRDTKYKVIIESKLAEGYLRYGEIFLKGKSDKEIIFTTNICHPALGNNETSGMVVLTFLAKYLSQKNNKYSYRFLFLPETIGSLAYIKKNFINLKKKLLFGFNCVCVGDERRYSLLESKNKNSNSFYFAKKTLIDLNKKFKIFSWLKRGSDERQFSAPNINLDFSSLMRSKYAEYKEYHTSLDNLKDVVTEKGLQGSLKMYQKLVELIEEENFPKSKFIGEPFLSKRKIYPKVGGNIHSKEIRNIVNYLSFCDGFTPSKKIVEMCKINSDQGVSILKKLKKNKLVSI